MNHSDLIDITRAAAETKLGYLPGAVTKKDATAIVEAVLEPLAAGLVEDGEVTLRGLGKLKLATRAGRTCRNPKTGDAIQVPPKRVVTFVPTQALRDALNP
jgi:nucleoid DNA-binding protein